MGSESDLSGKLDIVGPLDKKHTSSAGKKIAKKLRIESIINQNNFYCLNPNYLQNKYEEDIYDSLYLLYNNKYYQQQREQALTLIENIRLSSFELSKVQNEWYISDADQVKINNLKRKIKDLQIEFYGVYGQDFLFVKVSDMGDDGYRYLFWGLGIEGAMNVLSARGPQSGGLTDEANKEILMIVASLAPAAGMLIKGSVNKAIKEASAEVSIELSYTLSDVFVPGSSSILTLNSFRKMARQRGRGSRAHWQRDNPVVLREPSKEEIESLIKGKKLPETIRFSGHLKGVDADGNVVILTKHGAKAITSSGVVDFDALPETLLAFKKDGRTIIVSSKDWNGASRNINNYLKEFDEKSLIINVHGSNKAMHEDNQRLVNFIKNITPSKTNEVTDVFLRSCSQGDKRRYMGFGPVVDNGLIFQRLANKEKLNIRVLASDKPGLIIGNSHKYNKKGQPYQTIQQFNNWKSGKYVKVKYISRSERAREIESKLAKTEVIMTRAQWTVFGSVITAAGLSGGALVVDYMTEDSSD